MNSVGIHVLKSLDIRLMRWDLSIIIFSGYEHPMSEIMWRNRLFIRIVIYGRCGSGNRFVEKKRKSSSIVPRRAIRKNVVRYKVGSYFCFFFIKTKLLK